MTVSFMKTAGKVLEHGPTRVVINDAGEAVDPKRAARDHNIEPTIIFIRKDGWSLGAPDGLIEVARQIWDDEWEIVIQKTETEEGITTHTVHLYPDWVKAWKMEV